MLIARKSLLEMVREPQLLALVVLIPIVFLGITAFGYSAPLSATYRLLVDGPAGQVRPLVEALEAQRYPDGRPVFRIEAVSDRASADAALKQQAAAALLTVSPDGKTVTLKGDALYMRFYKAGIILETLLRRYADQAAGRPLLTQTIEQALGDFSPQTEFDIYAPGMIVFALLLIIPQTAMLIAREIRWGTLRRLRLSRLRAWEMLTGVSLAQLVVAGLQVVVVLATASALGFHNHGSPWLALVVGLAASFSAIGFGLVTACFIENDSQAVNVGSTVAMIQVFMSGSMYPLPPMTIFTLGGHAIDLFDVFPATHACLALQQVLSYGDGLREVSFRLGVTVGLSLLYFGLGVVLFQRRHMQMENCPSL